MVLPTRTSLTQLKKLSAFLALPAFRHNYLTEVHWLHRSCKVLIIAYIEPMVTAKYKQDVRLFVRRHGYYKHYVRLQNMAK